MLSASMKMADLVDLNRLLVLILFRMGIRFGFGDATVAEVCRRSGVDTDTFLLVCRVYTFGDYVPSAEDLRRVDIKEIVGYLRCSHSYYLQTQLPSLGAGIEHMLEPVPERQRKIIWKFFDDYKQELERHFEYEETVVFPYAESLISGTPAEGKSMDEFEEDHTNIEEKVGDLKNLVMKYLPSGCDEAEVVNVLGDIYLLEGDLERHTFIEDRILVPMILKKEENDG